MPSDSLLPRFEGDDGKWRLVDALRQQIYETPHTFFPFKTRKHTIGCHVLASSKSFFGRPFYHVPSAQRDYVRIGAVAAMPLARLVF